MPTSPPNVSEASRIRSTSASSPGTISAVPIATPPFATAGRAITYLRSLGNMAIVLVEQYLDFACELGDNFAVMDRGAVKYACDRSNLDPAEISRQMAL